LPKRPDLPALYAILDVDLTAARGLDPLALLDAWLENGIRLVQLRAKTMGGGAMVELGRKMVKRMGAAGGTLVVNDRADVALVVKAAGLHVGQDDLSPAEIRRLMGPGAIIGVSTHNAGQIEAAVAQPVSYIAIGPVFATGTKGGVTDAPVGLEGVRAAVQRAAPAGLPVVAIGGIALSTARDVLEAGAASVAVISDLLEGDPGDRVRTYRAALALARRDI
jgi:thiamine-phosphate pyrophosphorylase